MRRKVLTQSVVLTTWLSVFLTGTSYGDVQINNLPEFVESISIGGGTEIWARVDKNAFGVDGEDYSFVDALFRGNIAVNFKGGVEVNLGVIYTGTFGEDYFTSDYSLGGIENIGGPVYEGANSNVLEADDAYLKFKDIAGSQIDVTLGRQRIQVEKDFLMGDQAWRMDTNVYGNALTRSPFAAKIEFDLAPVNIMAYGAMIDTSDDMSTFIQGEDVNTFGLNIHYDINEKLYVYGGAINLQAETEEVFEDNLWTFYAGTDLTFGGLNISAEYAVQTGEDETNNVDRDANAGFAFAKYTFASVPMTPFVEVGGYFWSGDDPDTTDNEGFHTMGVGFPEWGKWFPGEVFGEQIYAGANNYKMLMLQSGFMPTTWMSLRLIYLKGTWLEKDNVSGVTVSDGAASNEINLFAEFFLSDNLYTGVLVGVGKPDTGLEELFGGDETAYTLMPFLVYSF